NVEKAKTAEKLSEVDAQVVAHQHAVNLFEVEMAKLALKNGSKAIQTYANTLIKDHQAADKNIAAFAKKQRLGKIPTDTSMTDADKKDRDQMTAKLKAMKGAAFDKDFVDMMLAGHIREITKLDADLALVENKDLATMLKDVRPVLQRHEE